MFKKFHETGKFDKNEIYPYTTEGIGEDILPKNVDFSIIDHFEKVTDKDAAYLQESLREEGILQEIHVVRQRTHTVKRKF